MVEYITYKGEKYPIRIAWSTLKKLESNMTEWERGETALWYGLVSGHIADNKELTLKQEDVPYILDESIMEFKQIMNKFNRAEENNNSENKKK